MQQWTSCGSSRVGTDQNLGPCKRRTVSWGVSTSNPNQIGFPILWLTKSLMTWMILGFPSFTTRFIHILVSRAILGLASGSESRTKTLRQSLVARVGIPASDWTNVCCRICTICICRTGFNLCRCAGAPRCTMLPSLKPLASCCCCGVSTGAVRSPQS